MNNIDLVSITRENLRYSSEIDGGIKMSDHTFNKLTVLAEHWTDYELDYNTCPDCSTYTEDGSWCGDCLNDNLTKLDHTHLDKLNTIVEEITYES